MALLGLLISAYPCIAADAPGPVLPGLSGEAPALSTETPPDLSNARLIGTVVGGERFAGAVIEDKAGEQKFYSRGDALPDGSRIVKVLSDRIMVKTGEGPLVEILAVRGTPSRAGAGAGAPEPARRNTVLERRGDEAAPSAGPAKQEREHIRRGPRGGEQQPGIAGAPETAVQGGAPGADGRAAVPRGKDKRSGASARRPNRPVGP